MHIKEAFVSYRFGNGRGYRKKKLEAKGVTQIAHFGPLYRFKVVSDMGYDADEIAKTCPVCEEVFYRRFTHLPLYGLSDEQLEYMADAVLEAVQEMSEGDIGEITYVVDEVLSYKKTGAVSDEERKGIKFRL